MSKLLSLAVLFFGLWGLTACSSVSESHAPHLKEFSDLNISKPMGIALPENKQFVLKESPWGENLHFTVEKTYFSASGRLCRFLHIAGTMNKILVCQNPDGSWSDTRHF